jgi:hypothetical protein
MAATKRLTMRFRDSNDRIVSFTVNPPVDPVDLTEVDALMDLIINTDTFYSYTGGAIVEKIDVQMQSEDIISLADYE